MLIDRTNSFREELKSNYITVYKTRNECIFEFGCVFNRFFLSNSIRFSFRNFITFLMMIFNKTRPTNEGKKSSTHTQWHWTNANILYTLSWRVYLMQVGELFRFASAIPFPSIGTLNVGQNQRQITSNPISLHGKIFVIKSTFLNSICSIPHYVVAFFFRVCDKTSTKKSISHFGPGDTQDRVSAKKNVFMVCT